MEVIIPVFFFMCVSAVLIFRPLTKRLGTLIEVMALERQGRSPGASSIEETQLQRITTLLEHMSGRMDLMEDRLNFMERLSDPRERQRLSS